MDLNSDLCPVVWGRATCSRSEQGTRPGPCCSWALPTGHGGAWFGGGSGRLQAGPWSCLGRGAWRGWVSPVPCLPLGAEPSPAQLIHAPLAQTPSTMAGSPPCLLAPWGGQQTPPLLGTCAPDPTACLGWGGTLHSSPSASPGTGQERAPPHQASSVGLPTPWGPAQEYPCPAAEVFVSK